MDSQFIWNSILTIGMTIMGGFAALGARYLGQIKESITERMDSQNKAIERLREDHKTDLYAIESKVATAQDDLGKFKILVYRDFVKQDEYIRTTQSLDAKIDRVLDEIGIINVNVAKLATAREAKDK